MSAPLNVGVIGCGNICDAYLNGMRRYRELRVMGCADRTVERAQAKAREHGLPLGCSIEALLAEPEIDLVVNLTVPKVHVELNRRTLLAGKHVYTEKPFSLDAASGAEVLKLAREKGLRVGSAPDTFLGGGLQSCRKQVDDGAIGVPVAATAFMLCRGHEGWHPSPAFYYEAGGGPMFDMGPYYLTALVHLLGPVRRVTGFARASFAERTIRSQPLAGTKVKVEVPTHHAGTVEFHSGVLVTVVMSFDVHRYPFPPIVVFGTEGTLEVPDPNTFGGEVRISRDGQTYTSVPLSHTPDRGRGTGVADLAAALRTGRPHRASGELAQHVVEVMEAFDRSAREGRAIEIASRCERPAMLPAGLAADEIDGE